MLPFIIPLALIAIAAVGFALLTATSKEQTPEEELAEKVRAIQNAPDWQWPETVYDQERD